MLVKPGSDKLITNGDMSIGFESEPIVLHGKNGLAIRADFTGAPVGVLFVAVGIDNDKWSVLPDSTVNITEAGDVTYNINDAKYNYAKLVWDPTSGNGNLNAKFNTKGDC